MNLKNKHMSIVGGSTANKTTITDEETSRTTHSYKLSSTYKCKITIFINKEITHK